MKITEATRLKDLLEEYPWLKDEIVKVNEKFEMLNSSLGKIMATKVDVHEMSKRSGMDLDLLISKLTDLIDSHQD